MFVGCLNPQDYIGKHTIPQNILSTYFIVPCPTDYKIEQCLHARSKECTDHTFFYERYGWEFLCMVQGDGEPDMTRMYIHQNFMVRNGKNIAVK